MAIRNTIKKFNEIICGENGILLGSCKDSMKYNKNFMSDILLALVFQYIVPLIYVMIIIPMIVGHFVVAGIIELLIALNPFSVVLYLPLSISGSFWFIFVFITLMIILILFWSYFHKKIGHLMWYPVIAWVVSILVFFIPIIGVALTIGISIFPAMVLMILVHRYVYPPSSITISSP